LYNSRRETGSLAGHHVRRAVDAGAGCAEARWWMNQQDVAMFPRRIHSAFTLLELLIVIVVIAIVAAILMPTLWRLQERVRRVKCLHNLRQFATSCTAYASDYRGWFPKGSDQTGTGASCDFLHYMDTDDFNTLVRQYGCTKYDNHTMRGCASTEGGNTRACPSGDSKLRICYFGRANEGWGDTWQCRSGSDSGKTYVFPRMINDTHWATSRTLATCYCWWNATDPYYWVPHVKGKYVDGAGTQTLPDGLAVIRVDGSAVWAD
jgi:prepilin-type N-terminal cleavage/methylation domain-containing protein